MFYFLKLADKVCFSVCVYVCVCAGAAQRPALCWWFRCMRWTMPCAGLGLHKSDPTTRVAKWSLWQFYGHNTLSWQPSAFLAALANPLKRGNCLRPALPPFSTGLHCGSVVEIRLGVVVVVVSVVVVVAAVVWLAGHNMTHFRAKPQRGCIWW